MRFILAIWMLAGAAFAEAPQRIDWSTAPLRLLLVERPGCQYCAQWRSEVGPGYATSRQGRAAPLMIVDMDGPWPDGLALDRRAWLTPTFILLSRGQEIARIEGYPGAKHFYPLLDELLARAP